MKKLSELSLNELNRRSSTLKGVLIGFGILGLLAAGTLYFLEAKSVLYIPVMVFPVILLPMVIALKQVSDEINSRDSKHTAEI